MREISLQGAKQSRKGAKKKIKETLCVFAALLCAFARNGF